ncbi:hypothetical protein NGF69_16665 [Enterococcus casseliflavus]|nr:hypothetical protein [Enterococcus casseliflavus]
MKKWSEYTNKQKLLIVACSLGVICGGTFGGYKAYAANQQATEKQELQQALHAVTEKGSLTNAILSFQDPDGYLTEYLVKEDLETIQKQLEALKKQCDTFEEQYPGEKIKEEQDISEQEELLKLVEKKLAIQDQVNALFTTETPAINGSKVNKDLALAEGVDKEAIEQIDTTDDTLSKDKWLESIESLKTVANEQITAIEKADKAVNACYKDKKVASNVTKKNYEEAEKAVKAVKRGSDKERLTKKLAEIKKVVEENEKKAKEKEKEKEKKDQQSTASAETKSQTETATTVTEETAVADTTNEVSTNNAGGSWSSTGSVTGSGNTSSASTSGGVSKGSGTTSNGASSSGNGGSNSGSSNSGSNNGGSATSPGGSGDGTANTPTEPTIVSGYIGNTGLVFDSGEAATIYAEQKLDSGEINRYVLITIYYSDGSEKFSLSFY